MQNAPTTAIITPGRQGVLSLLSGLAAGLGIGGRYVFKWDRSGASTLDLLAGQQWTAHNIYGAVGQFSLESPRNDVKDMRLSYRLADSDLELDAHAKLPGIVPMLSPSHPAAVGASQPVGFGLGAIVTLLPFLWSLLNPRVTLNLPPQMAIDLIMADTNTLVIEFKTPPTVTVVWGMQWTNVPLKLMLTDRLVRIEYRFGIFNRTQDWEL